VALCKPLESSKWPWRIAPATSNIFSNSSRVNMDLPFDQANLTALLNVETSAA
jgi:hypothetical protein